jgi:hypothetical protein
MQGALELAGQRNKRTVILAPHFLDSTDVDRVDPAGHPMLTWNGSDPNGPWRSGLYDVTNAVTSYQAMDALFAALPCPTTSVAVRVVLAGHSSGGQFVHRFTLLGAMRPSARCGPTASFKVRSVVANPSSYIYFSPVRPAAVDPPTTAGVQAWLPPSPVRLCPAYNSWQWGLDGELPPYIRCGPLPAEHRDVARCIDRYRGREVVHLLGLTDDCTILNSKSGPTHGRCPDHAFEITCSDMVQGPSRLARGRNFFEYQRSFFTNTTGGGGNSRVVEVPRAGHDQANMYQSPATLAAIFSTA